MARCVNFMAKSLQRTHGGPYKTSYPVRSRRDSKRQVVGMHWKTRDFVAAWHFMSRCVYSETLIRNEGVGSSNLSCGTSQSLHSLLQNSNYSIAHRKPRTCLT